MSPEGIKALGAAIAISLGAASTAYAQARIGSAAVGALTEKKEIFGLVVTLMALPELIVILAFVIALMILQ